MWRTFDGREGTKSKVVELKVELQRCAWEKNVNKDVLYNKILEAVVNNLPILDAEVEVNEAGGMQVTFPNPTDGWIMGSRWRDLRLKKYTLEEITEASFFSPTT